MIDNMYMAETQGYKIIPPPHTHMLFHNLLTTVSIIWQTILLDRKCSHY